MIIEKDGQIIVTELRPMSELLRGEKVLALNKITGIFVDVVMDDNEIYWDMGWYSLEAFHGWIPLPIYQPQQKQEPVYLECGE